MFFRGGSNHAAHFVYDDGASTASAYVDSKYMHRLQSRTSPGCGVGKTAVEREYFVFAKSLARNVRESDRGRGSSIALFGLHPGIEESAARTSRPGENECHGAPLRS